MDKRALTPVHLKRYAFHQNNENSTMKGKVLFHLRFFTASMHCVLHWRSFC